LMICSISNSVMIHISCRYGGDLLSGPNT
jgi:hypothetical protein